MRAAQMANHMVFQMLIYNGISVDIMYASAYDTMGLKREALKPVKVSLLLFTSEKVFPEGFMELPLTVEMHLTEQQS